MSEGEKATSKSPAGPLSPRPESPTTARPLEFDDEYQETGATPTSSAPPPSATEAPPPKPPRPLSPQQQAENTLKEAFPSVELSVVKAVLMASSYDVERAFHALLGMTDPSAQEDYAPPKPPRPTAAQRQLEADELYARQLAEHYNRRAQPARGGNEDPYSRQRRGEEQEDEKEYNFFDDDLPVIRENIRKGFLDTQTKVNAWVQNLKKRLDGEEEDEDNHAARGYGEESYGRPRRSGDLGRRSGDRERYDADPQVLSDDFSALELRDTEAPPPRPPRPLANPTLYKSSSPSPDRRKVSFQEGPPTEIGNLYDASEPAKRQSPAAGRPSKWQPLSTVEPSPIGENDPFSLGDSDDEKGTKTKDQAITDERDGLHKATVEAVPEELGSASKDGAKENSAAKSS
ncbi:hypothetical protein BJX63DRAFT_440610 [Aspergillus granulosus]|uniref:CUE domain-containing protein n=1 Tax=Aspergillus granulosus TaxID=176169 RepID=A0ABR4GUN9_9EURO